MTHERQHRADGQLVHFLRDDDHHPLIQVHVGGRAEEVDVHVIDGAVEVRGHVHEVLGDESIRRIGLVLHDDGTRAHLPYDDRKIDEVGAAVRVEAREPYRKHRALRHVARDPGRRRSTWRQGWVPSGPQERIQNVSRTIHERAFCRHVPVPPHQAPQVAGRKGRPHRIRKRGGMRQLRAHGGGPRNGGRHPDRCERRGHFRHRLHSEVVALGRGALIELHAEARGILENHLIAQRHVQEARR